MASASKGPLNYTTVIDPVKSAGECTAILAAHGAKAIATTYDDGVPTGLAFTIGTQWGIRQFSLPVNVPATHKALMAAAKAGKIPPRYSDKTQAERVAWRVLKDWLEVQIALIEAGVAELSQVLLPWRVIDEGETVWDRYIAQEEQLALTAAADG